MATRTIPKLKADVQLVDPADETKSFDFDVSSVAPGSKRTLAIPDMNLVLLGTTSPQTVTNKVIDAGNNTITGVGNDELESGIDATKIADGSVSDAEFQRLNGVTGDIQTQLDGKAEDDHVHVAADIPDFNATVDGRITLQKAAPNGLATLGGDGKVPIAQMPISGLQYQGLWDADANDPALASGVGTQGHQYRVSVAGTTLIDGVNDWQPGDYLTFNGTIWQKTDNTDQVTTVAGKQGAVVLVAGDITDDTFADARIAESNVKQHEAALEIANMIGAPTGTPVGTDDAQTLTNKTISGDDNTITNLDASMIGDGSVSDAEFQRLNGVTDDIQGQIDNITVINTVVTNDGNATTLASIPTQNDMSYLVEARIIAKRTDAGSESAAFVITRMFRNNGGVLSPVGNDRLAIKDVMSWNAVVQNSGTNIRIRVTGEVGKTISWKLEHRLTFI